LDQLPYFSALLLFALWLPNQLFSSDVGLLSSLNLNNKLTAKSNFAGAAIILILFDLSATGLAQASITQDTHSFAVLFITVCASILLWRVCKSIIEIENLLPQKQKDDEQRRISLSGRLPNLIYRLLLISLILAPILVSVGYVNAGQELIKSIILSLVSGISKMLTVSKSPFIKYLNSLFSDDSGSFTKAEVSSSVTISGEDSEVVIIS